MLTFGLPRGIRHCDGLTRREVMRVGAIGLGGLSLPHLLGAGEASARSESTRPTPVHRSVVILYLSGGPSQLDMWDMKPEAPLEIRGTFRPIETRVPGIQVCEHMPRMARVADKYTIVRSMSHGEAEHLRAGYWVMTGAPLLRPVVQASGMLREDRPHAGAVLSRFLKRPPDDPAVRHDPRVHLSRGRASTRSARGFPRAPRTILTSSTAIPISPIIRPGS